jgi:hypothetical protein
MNLKENVDCVDMDLPGLMTKKYKDILGQKKLNSWLLLYNQYMAP